MIFCIIYSFLLLITRGCYTVDIILGIIISHYSIYVTERKLKTETKFDKKNVIITKRAKTLETNKNSEEIKIEFPTDYKYIYVKNYDE